MVRIIIECEDYCVADSLRNLANYVNNSDILKPIYEDDSNTETHLSDHYKSFFQHDENGTDTITLM